MCSTEREVARALVVGLLELGLERLEAAVGWQLDIVLAGHHRRQDLVNRQLAVGLLRSIRLLQHNGKPRVQSPETTLRKTWTTCDKFEELPPFLLV